MDAFDRYETERDEFVRVTRRHSDLNLLEPRQLYRLYAMAVLRVAVAQQRLDTGDDWYSSAAAQKKRWTGLMEDLLRVSEREEVTTR